MLRSRQNTWNVLKTRQFFVLGVSAIFAVFAAGCGGKPFEGAPGKAAGGRPPARVYVGQVEFKEVTPRTVVVGTVVPKRISVVASGADGKVNRFLVQEGDLVEEGQELSVLNQVTTDLGIEEAKQTLEMRKQQWTELRNGSRPEEITKAIAETAAAKAAYDAAIVRLNRQRELERNQAVNQDELDNAIERAETTKQLYEAARAQAVLIQKGPREEQVQQAEANWKAQQEQVDYLIAEKAKRTTTAPFKGMIVAEHTEAGQWLSKGDSVVTISDLLDEVYVIANVDQLEISNIRPGAKVDLEINAPGKSAWKGIVESIVPRSEWRTGSRTFPVKVVVQNEVIEVGGKPQPRLSEGMYARVIFTGIPQEALLVPKNAVIRSEIGSRVVAVLPGETPQTGTAKPVMIQEGVAYGEMVQVLDGELNPGMTVVTEGAERLSPFQSVQIAAPISTEAKKPSPTQEEPAPDSEESD